MTLTLIAGAKTQISPPQVKTATGQKNGGKNVYLHHAPTASSASPSHPPRAARLRPRGDESDQSDQSTEITVIPEVRGRAAGHSEFTHPTRAADKSVQEWRTCARKNAIL